MEITIKKNGTEHKIKVILKGKHTDRIWQALEAGFKNKENQMEGMLNVRKLAVEIACEITGLKEDELNDQEVEVKNTLVNYIQEKTYDEMGFVRSLLKQ